ncbi:AhpC/TSA family protein [Actinomycetospora cinnamomea]|uniref:AhpC/TSA family protein n=1 Tax=Actinomycetospora cinnamomea TaxID=663609 RepID=A0A2U1EXH0_9PSEU|nr:AhpC/TSA family protein [Actinomycetospora cinnamomea]
MVGISVDAPPRNAAMVDKLRLPFPLLADEDGEQAIKPFEVWHEGADLARPAVIVLDRDGREAVRQVGQDFADRLPDGVLLARVQALGLPATSQDAPAPGKASPSAKAMPFAALKPYFLGGRFTSISLGDRVPEAKERADVMREMYDGFIDAVDSTRAA